jgi:S-adenosylmethionine-diacylgycerolhomoserine-N-methlytransferase
MNQAESLRRYYRLHAAVYDATRWLFLFGRSALIRQLASMRLKPRRVLEIGCGTGRNLDALARVFPDARLVGIDLSEDMLARARRRLAPHKNRVELHGDAYGPSTNLGQFDVIVASYALSMMGEGAREVLDAARRDLRPGGVLAVVDFRDSRFGFFRRWMGMNHVRLDDSLVPVIRQRFAEPVAVTRRAYFGLWRWFTLIA